MIGLIINQNGNMISFNYNINDINNFKDFEKYVDNKEKDFILLEEFEDNNEDVYLVYGYKNGTKFNKWDFLYSNPFGDVIIIKTKGDTENFLNVDIPYVYDFYKSEEEIEYIIDEEEEIGDYDYTDDFLEDDRYTIDCLEEEEILLGIDNKSILH